MGSPTSAVPLLVQENSCNGPIDVSGPTTGSGKSSNGANRRKWFRHWSKENSSNGIADISGHITGPGIPVMDRQTSAGPSLLQESSSDGTTEGSRPIMGPGQFQ